MSALFSAIRARQTAVVAALVALLAALQAPVTAGGLAEVGPVDVAIALAAGLTTYASVWQISGHAEKTGVAALLAAATAAGTALQAGQRPAAVVLAALVAGGLALAGASALPSTEGSVAAQRTLMSPVHPRS